MPAPLALASLMLFAAPISDTLPIRVTVDSGRYEVLIEYRVEAAPHPSAAMRDAEHPDHDGHGGDHSGHARRLLRFEWPITGWLRGARVAEIFAANAKCFLAGEPLLSAVDRARGY